MADSTNVDLYNLPDNSKAGREKREREKADAKRAEKVVRGKVKTRKNEMRKLSDIFISEDAANVKNYILMDVIVPAIKKALYDGVTNSLDMILFGGRGSSGKRSTADKVSYRDYSSSSRDRGERSRNSSRAGSRIMYDDILFDSRADAKDVLERMDEIMDEYEIVRVADMFDLAGISCDHTLNDYGWTDIRSAKVEAVRDGYIIKMPRALPIR